MPESRAVLVRLVRSICRRLVRWIDNGITLVLASRVTGMGNGIRLGCPVEARLRGYGTLRALVFGSWGEVSANVEWLLSEPMEIGLSRRSGFRPAEDDEPDSLRATVLATPPLGHCRIEGQCTPPP